MKPSTQKELHHLLTSLGVRLLYVNSDIIMQLRESCKPARARLVEEEETPGSLFEQSFWELSSKYQLDILLIDIQVVANQLAYTIGFAEMNKEVAKQQIDIPYLQEGEDVLFWYHADFGLRLAASGWDHIALLLNLVFDLDLAGRGCTLSTVMQQLPKHVSEIEAEPDFKKLKKFRDGRYAELQSRHAGEGARDEITHLMSAYSRLMFETFEVAPDQKRLMILRQKPQEQVDFLKEHHSLYLEGIKDTSKLIQTMYKKNA